MKIFADKRLLALFALIVFIVFLSPQEAHAATVSITINSVIESGGGGGGDSDPPSVTTGFSEDEPVLQINGNSFTSDDLGITQDTITVQQGKAASFKITLYDNNGAGNILHIDLFLDKSGERVLNDQTETYITYDNGQVTIHDPNGTIESAEITKTEDGNKATFSFEIVFSGKVKNPDILVRAWDYQRNVMYLHVDNILNVMPGPIANQPEMDKQAQEVQTQDEAQEVPLQDEAQEVPLQDTTEQTIRQWAGYDAKSATDEQLVEAMTDKQVADDKTAHIPDWLKDDVSGWYVSGDITYDEFTAAFDYLYDLGVLVS